MLELSLPGPAAELLKRVNKNSVTEISTRVFALTLQFYSSKAYNFVRKTFKTCLPHPTTIRKWYQSIDGSPGFTKEALSALTIKVKEAQENNKKVICGLIIEEMSICKKLEWDGAKFSGFGDRH